MAGILEYGFLMVGVVLGGAVGWLLAKQSMSSKLVVAEERLRASEENIALNEQRIRAEVENIAIKIGEDNSAKFIELANTKLNAQQKDAAHELSLIHI